MATAEHTGIGLIELSQALKSVDPRIVLVHPRVLRRVVRGILGNGPFVRQAPHLAGFTAVGEVALRHAEPDEMGLAPYEAVPPYLILLAQPEDDQLHNFSRDQMLVRYWRQIFHARIHLFYNERGELFPHGDDWVASRVERLGRIEFAEARQVLVEDALLVLPADDRSTFIEFAAVYLELTAFHPEILPDTFPAIRNHAGVCSLFAEDLDAQALLEATRPPGAPPSPPLTTTDDDFEASSGDEPGSIETAPESPPAPGRWGRLKKRAETASDQGNNVRAAILKTRAALLAPRLEAPRTRASARSELDTLARRLRVALGFDAEEAARWRRALPALLDRAARGHWPREARLLSDLQKICIDHERPIYAIDLPGWVITFGKRPLKRVLPDHREVVILKHLRVAARRLHNLRGLEPARENLEQRVARAIHHKEAEIRNRFREPIRKAFDDVGLQPHNLPERAARRKLIEELLDLVVERGFLRIGDLRDALSRSQIKLPDLASVGQLLRGNALLRADDELSRALDGVYYRGEIYLRGLQRASLLAFGTRLGRALSRLVALPFGGAFVILEGLQHIVGPIVHATGGVAPQLFNPLSLIALGFLLVGLINLARFRKAFFAACASVGRLLRLLFHDAPKWVLERPIIRDFINSRSFLLGWNWVAKPIVIFLTLSIFFPLLSRPGLGGLLVRAATLIGLSLAVNSRSGRDVEEIAADGASRVGQRLWRDVLPSLFRGVLDFFAAGLEMVERVIYSVDEWLRFRGGEGRFSLGVKAVLGAAWFVVAYIARLYINLLIEPQINPIKHFPVVTVSHKIILPMSLTIIRIVRAPLMPLGPELANTIAATTVFLLPGVFGFLVWELKENWRLYAANRPRMLGPVAIGHHGETLSRLLRRGFHSGTLPKLYAKLRKADRRVEEGRGFGGLHKTREAIAHVEVAVRRLIERGIVYLMDESRSIGSVRVRPGEVGTATNRIVVELVNDAGPGPSARIAFEESSQRLHARLAEPGWLANLDREPRRTLTSALAALYAMSDADFVIDPSDGSPSDLRTVPIPWSAWVDAWEDDAAGRGHAPVVPDECRIIPEARVNAPSRGL